MPARPAPLGWRLGCWWLGALLAGGGVGWAVGGSAGLAATTWVEQGPGTPATAAVRAAALAVVVAVAVGWAASAMLVGLSHGLLLREHQVQAGGLLLATTMAWGGVGGLVGALWWAVLWAGFAAVAGALGGAVGGAAAGALLGILTGGVLVWLWRQRGATVAPAAATEALPAAVRRLVGRATVRVLNELVVRPRLVIVGWVVVASIMGAAGGWLVGAVLSGSLVSAGAAVGVVVGAGSGGGLAWLRRPRLPVGAPAA